ncbi:hypothetical protein M413DRAFT_441555 [Hebeloma cylindrosporum]|uniref:Uncharacterized protein n=1 Tax=Hebeloma cylindrosporum TaxID=76867 RepID=A0A0C2YZQ3_HEBCY|nr:hypothetical protein M413DRAFT_441555 [Hebeloma cylindrosporum h7]
MKTVIYRSGAIRRASVDSEKEPFISYENFVNELDTGDSFTASLIDILVKEVADRRSRSNANDRRLISDRNIRSLRLLANTRAYPRMPPRHARRAVNLTTEYFTASPNELEMDYDEDEFEGLAENPTTIEGARVNSDLFEAFTTSPWPPPSARRIVASPSPVAEEWPGPLPMPPLRSPPSSSARPWSAPAPPATAPPSNLSRQASIRRAATRARMVDFNDFTTRRRSTIRDSLSTGRDVPEIVTEPRDGVPGPTIRRFFPFPRARRHQATNSSWAEYPDTLSPDSPDEPVHFLTADATPASWFEHQASPEPVRPSEDVENREETEQLLRAPRLRRGGVRAPESMLSRHASPITITAPPPNPPAEPTTSELASRRDEATPTPAEEPVAYPTPGSSENEILA